MFEAICNSVEIAVDEQTEYGSCSRNFETTYTWVAKDTCENAADLVFFTVRSSDTTPPVFEHSLPPQIEVEYDSVPSIDAQLAALGAAYEPEDPNTPRPSLSISYSEQTESGASACASTLVRSFTAEDECGNSVTQTVTIVVVDNTPPILEGVPASETLECSTDEPDQCEVKAFDCQGAAVAVTQTDAVFDNPSRRIRTWTAVDASNNEATGSQTISFLDTTAPMLSRKPENTIESCDCDGLPAAPTLKAIDNCDAVVVSLSEEKVNGSSADEYDLIRTWSASDQTGNKASHTQTVSVVDTDAPTFIGPTETTSDCSAPTQNLLARDNCDENPTVTYSEISASTTGCTTVYTYTATATDKTGNSNEETVTHTANDESSPVLAEAAGFPGAVCDGKTSAIITTLGFGASDNCGTPTIKFLNCTVRDPDFNEVRGAGSCTMRLESGVTTGVNIAVQDLGAVANAVVGFEAEDECGNKAYAHRLVALQGSTNCV
jgi:hypothetical protein